MRRAPSFHNRIFPSRSLPMTEYSVEDSRILLTNSTACCVLARIELSKSPGFIAASCQTVARQWGNKSSQPSSTPPLHRPRKKYHCHGRTGRIAKRKDELSPVSATHSDSGGETLNQPEKLSPMTAGQMGW